MSAKPALEQLTKLPDDKVIQDSAGQKESVTDAPTETSLSGWTTKLKKRLHLNSGTLQAMTAWNISSAGTVNI